MVTLLHPLMVPSDIHDIEPLFVTLVGGPDHGDASTVSRIYTLDGKRAVIGRAGEGFYHLPSGSRLRHHVDTGRALAVWEVHDNVRVSWTCGY